MYTSQSVSKIAPALLAAQKLMGAALKGSTNPFFRSKYADLGSVLEALKEPLNANGITILQPIGRNEFGTFVETMLLHESGEFVSSITPVIFAKEGDPQAQGSAITYARRYGLQSLPCLPAEDDDGEKAMARTPKKEPVKETKVVPQTSEVSLTDVVTVVSEAKPRTTFRKPALVEGTAVPAMSNGKTDDLGLS